MTVVIQEIRVAKSHLAHMITANGRAHSMTSYLVRR